MFRHARITLTAAVTASTLVLAGCADDGAGVTDLGAESGDPGSGSGSGSGSGLGSDLQGESDNPLVADAVAEYHTYVVEQVETTQVETTVLTDAVRDGDLDAAQDAYASSREGWERIEPIAGLIPELDGVLDSRVDDFEGVKDPEFTGWHRLEYLLFEQEETDGGEKFADLLDADLDTLAQEVADLDVPAAALPVGASELIEEVSLGKITGEENRYAKTDLWDLAANVDGARVAVDLLTPALDEADPELTADLATSFDDLDSTLKPLRDGEGWVLYCLEDDEFPSERCPEVTVEPEVVEQLQAQTAALSEQTSQMAGALGLSQ